MDKVVSSPEEAVADIPTGATVAIAGFGLGHRFPSSLIQALRDHGAKELCLVCNSLGTRDEMRGQALVENKQVRKLIAAFSARPGLVSAVEEQIAAGELEMELVPQGTLVERMRAAGAGVPAFYTPTAADTVLATGKEIRHFDGRPHVLERALHVDYALLRAHRADPLGNLQFRGGSQNFNPSFAKAARVAIAEVDEIVDVGEIPPDRVGLAGICVSRVVKSTLNVPVALNASRRRAATSRRHYNDKPALTREEIAREAANLLADESYVNLGTGIPTLVSNYVTDRGVFLHAENGILGYGSLVGPEDADPDIYNAGGQFVSLQPGAAFFDSVSSFEMARSGKLDAVVLGAYQVDGRGNLANWSTPQMVGGGIGGAMDLAVADSTLVIVMEHLSSRGEPKLVRECSYPLTASSCVDIVVTDLVQLRRVGGEFVLEQVTEGFSPDEVAELIDFPVRRAATIGTMRLGGAS